MFNKAVLLEKWCFSDTKTLEQCLSKVLIEKSPWNSLLSFLSTERERFSGICEVLTLSGKKGPGNGRVDGTVPFAVKISV